MILGPSCLVPSFSLTQDCVQCRINASETGFEYETTGTVTPTMLWDPSLTTWRGFGVRINSQMMVASADLSLRTELFYGFGAEQQQAIIDALPELFA